MRLSRREDLSLLLLCAVLPIAACDGDGLKSGDGVLALKVPSQWGDASQPNSQHTMFEVTPYGSRFLGPCLQGLLPARIPISDAGTFEVTGTLAYLSGTATGSTSSAAQFRGTLQGGRLSLQIVVANAPTSPVYQLVYNDPYLGVICY